MPKGIYPRCHATESARAKRRVVTGFLRPQIKYRVLVGTTKQHDGTNLRDAHRAFKTWCKYSANREGVSAGKTVHLYGDDKHIATFTP